MNYETIRTPGLTRLDEREKPAATPAYAWVILFAVLLAGVAAPFNQFKVPPVMPVLMNTFQLDLGTAGMLMSIFAITGLVLALPAGIILQKLGPKTAGLAAMGCLLGGSLLGGLASQAGFLLASRLVEGIGMGLIAVVGPTVIAAWFPANRRGLPMGIWATWVSLGSLVIYILAPLLAEAAGWRSVWWAGAAFALVAFVFYGLLVRLPPAAPAAEAPFQAPDLQQVLANRDLWLLALGFCCFNLVVIGVIATFYPTYLKAVHGYSLANASYVTSIKMMVVITTAPLMGWLSDRIGSPKRIMLVSYAALAVYMLFPFAVRGGLVLVCMAMLGILAGAIPTATFSSVPEAMRKTGAAGASAGIGMAVIMIGQNLGQLLGPVIFARLVQSVGWPTAGYWMAAFMLIGMAAAWFTRVR